MSVLVAVFVGIVGASMLATALTVGCVLGWVIRDKAEVSVQPRSRTSEGLTPAPGLDMARWGPERPGAL